MPTKRTVQKVTTPTPAMIAAPKATARAKPIPEATEVRAAAKPKAETPKAVKVPSKPDAPVKLSIALDASAANVEKFIKSIQVRGAKLDTDMHSAACACLNHAAVHNDPTLLNRLVNAFPKAARKNAVIVWALQYGNVALNEDKSTRKDRPVVYMKGKAADIEAAVANPFWKSVAKEGGGTEWLYMDYISNVMKKLASVAIDTANPEHRKAKAALDALNAVNEALNTKPNGDAPVEFIPDVTPDRRKAANEAIH